MTIPVETVLSQIPEGSGDWTLRLEITASTNQTKLSGTAEAVLPDGTRFLPIVGSYTPKADTATLVAKGRGANKGIWIQLKSIRSASPGTLERGAVTYGIQGFTGKQSLVPAPPRD